MHELQCLIVKLNLGKVFKNKHFENNCFRNDSITKKGLKFFQQNHNKRVISKKHICTKLSLLLQH